MKYEIGQKVETPLGVGVIKKVETWPDGHTQFVVYINDVFVTLSSKQLNLYRTPHEKLIDLGFTFEEVLNWGGNPFSHNWRKGDQRITIYLFENTVTTYEVCKEAIAVLTEYLEWLEEGK